MLSTKKEELITKQAKVSSKLYKMCMKKKISDTMMRTITSIIKEKSTQGSEQRYQAVSNITDILNNSKTEQELIQKLNEAYPMR